MRMKAKLKWILLGILGIFLLFTASSTALGQSNSLIDKLWDVDVFHPPADDTPEYIKLLYNEWHYFNVMDEEQDISMICVFKLKNANGPDYAVEVLLGYYVEGSPNSFFGTYPIKDAVFSGETPNFEINKNFVRLTDEGYSIHIESEDGATVFDALFKPAVEPSLMTEVSGFSPLYGGSIDWMVASSKMKVNGKLSLNGQVYTLKNVRGYHDHNWGYWNWGDDIGWNWGQVSETKSSLNGNDVGNYSLTFGEITDALHLGKPINSVLNVWKNKKIIASFSGEEIVIDHDNEHDNNMIYPPIVVLPMLNLKDQESFPLPVETEITASSGSDNLKIVFTTKKAVPLPVTVPIMDEYGNLVEVQYRIIWEMMGKYEIIDGEIDGKAVSYSADGFMEYVYGMPISIPPQLE